LDQRQPTLSHGDLNGGNILIDIWADNKTIKLWFIDFEKMWLNTVKNMQPIWNHYQW
jgi:thiamine kinase-like enzyme